MVLQRANPSQRIEPTTAIDEVTARSRNVDRERCLAAGMDDFLTKPVRLADLLAAIDRLAPLAGLTALFS